MNREIKPGDLVLHFKWELDHKAYDHLYEVIAVGKDCDTMKDVITYRRICDNTFWTRSVKEFLSTVDRKKYVNIKQKYRFQLLKENNYVSYR